MRSSHFQKGITLLEIIIVIAVAMVMTGGIFITFSTFIARTQVDDAAQEILTALRRANTSSSARLHNLSWGVYLDDTASRFTFFGGDNYLTRTATHDIVTTLPNSVTYSQISLNGGGKEVVFRKIAGDTTQYGSFKLAGKNNEERTVTINQLGQIEIQ